MQKRYTDPHPPREPRRNKVVPMEEFRQDMEGYRPELQYSQLQPRGIDPDVILRKSEGQLMRTFEANNLVGSALDELAVDQLRREEGEENAMRMRQIATDAHLPGGVVRGHVAEAAAAPAHRALVGDLHAHADAHAARDAAARHAAALDHMARQMQQVARAESIATTIRASSTGLLTCP